MEHRVTVTTKATFTKMCYGWSKYGGPMYGLVKDEQEWCCQACGKTQPEGFPQYMMPMDTSNREFLRICSVCKHTQLKKKMNYQKLIELVRNHL